MKQLKIFNLSINDPIPTATFFPLLSKEQCEQILTDFITDTPMTAKVNSRADGKGIEASGKRSTLIHPVPYSEKSEWLYDLISDRVASYNQFGYQFNIMGVYSDIQLLEYPEGGHYDWHMDIGPGDAALRKLSVIIQLSDPSEYEGGETVFNTGTEHVLPKTQGQIAVFPSFVLHKVNPVTSGRRYALVLWFSGGERFK